MSQVEILAPAGSREALMAAIYAGANAVYFGMGALNMRTHSGHNFVLSDLSKIVDICKAHQTSAYVTLNAIIYDDDLPLMREACDAIKASGAHAVIASDIAVIQYARSIDLPVHISTQLNVCNLEGVRFFSKYADVIVLARELSLDQIRAICTSIKSEEIRGPSGNLVNIEVFVHGALCVSISGKCYMSLAQYNYSANRGECLQACRRRYRVIDEETNEELILENKYVMSPKDLCMIGFLDKIIDAGVNVLKIEGRGRAPEYVYIVTKIYREGVDSYYANNLSPEKIEAWNKKLKRVYNRGFWQGGYYLGKKLGEWSGMGGSQATTRKKYIGKVTNYFSKIGVAEVKIESDNLKVGEKIMITGPTTGIIEGSVDSLHQEGSIDHAEKGSVVSFPIVEKVRKHDKLYVIEKKK